MSQYSPELRQEGVGTWLPLTEYAVRCGISLSTIRRKIKLNRIPFRLDRGRYLIFIENENAPVNPRVASDTSRVASSPSIPPQSRPASGSASEPAFDGEQLPFLGESIRMITRAFETTIREKDERILMLEKRSRELEERLSELRTLVRILEEKFEVRY